MPRSWEWYQEAGDRQYWLCGLAGATFTAERQRGTVLPSLPLMARSVYAVPFDQLKNVTVNRIFINVTNSFRFGSARLAIYANAGANDNRPGTRVVGTAEVNPNGTAGLIHMDQRRFSFTEPLGINLAGGNRYWAVLVTYDNANLAVIDGLGSTTSPIIFWGVEDTNLVGHRLLPRTGRYGVFPGVNSLPAEFGFSSNSTDIMPCIGLEFETVSDTADCTMVLGSINGYAPPNVFAAGGVMVGTLSASAVYVGSIYYGATAYQNLGTTGNTSSVIFFYQGSEAAGGATAGVRWNDSAQQGIFAFIDSSGPTLRIYEMDSGWVFVQDASTSLTLTAGNGYTLTLADNGSVVTASITDDTGVQNCSITTSLNTGNTETLFGWVGTTASYVFNAPIVGVTMSQTGTVATPDVYPVAGTYMYADSVFLSSTPGASIYYTTDGSTPTSGSTPYTGPISVTASETVKAIGILAGSLKPDIVDFGGLTGYFGGRE